MKGRRDWYDEERHVVTSIEPVERVRAWSTGNRPFRFDLFRHAPNLPQQDIRITLGLCIATDEDVGTQDLVVAGQKVVSQSAMVCHMKRPVRPFSQDAEVHETLDSVGGSCFASARRLSQLPNRLTRRRGLGDQEEQQLD